MRRKDIRLDKEEIQSAYKTLVEYKKIVDEREDNFTNNILSIYETDEILESAEIIAEALQEGYIIGKSKRTDINGKQYGEVVLVVAVHLVHGMSAFMKDGEHIVRKIMLIVVSGETDIAVVEVFSEGVFYFSQSDLVHVETHHVTDLFGEFTLCIDREGSFQTCLAHLRSGRHFFDKRDQAFS